MQKTNIEYLDYTVSPIAMRCSPLSNGCASCWHLAMCDRMKNNPKIPMELREIYAGDRPPMLIQSRLDAILKHKKPAVIGLQFMGDLFFDDWPMIDEVLIICQKAYWHTFLILTKRIEAAWYYFKSPIYERPSSYRSKFLHESENIYLGVSVEDQTTADERIPILLQIPAAAKYVISYEPALNSLYLRPEWLKKVGFSIAGCESGPNRRPAKIEWFRAIKNQCIEDGIPYFLKQVEMNGKIVKMPELDGRNWAQLPKNNLTGG